VLEVDSEVLIVLISLPKLLVDHSAKQEQLLYALSLLSAGWILSEFIVNFLESCGPILGLDQVNDHVVVILSHI
jgi:hypothetical protein